MTATDLLVDLLGRADMDVTTAAIVTADEVSQWPDGALAVLLDAGVLGQTQPEATVTCNACFEEHSEGVEFVESPGASPRAYIVCPEAGRVAVDVNRLVRWRVEPRTIAGALATLIGHGTEPKELVRDRLWQLGSCDVGSANYKVLLGRGLGWPDQRNIVSPSLLGLLEPTFILSLAAMPAPPFSVRVAPLTQLASLDHGRLALDFQRLSTIVAQPTVAGESAEGTRGAAGPPGFDHLSDSRTVNAKGQSYSLTVQQARVVQVLYEALLRGVPELGHVAILERAQLSGTTIRDTFKRSAAWKRLIVPGERKGMYRLDV